MSLQDFKNSLLEDQPPSGISTLLSALWFDAKWQWDKAHNLAQEIDSKQGSWVHAYLHRKEGDRSNASYWYQLAGKPFPDVSLEAEWEEIVVSLLIK